MVITSSHTVGEVIVVDIAGTVGQESAIAANGSPVFEIRVTCPAQTFGDVAVGGFGIVLGDGPVAGYEILYMGAGVIGQAVAR